MSIIDGEVKRKTMQGLLIIMAIILAIAIIAIVLTVRANPRQIEDNSHQRDLEIQKLSSEFKMYEGDKVGSTVKNLITEIINNNMENEDYILYINGKSKQSDLIEERSKIISGVKYKVKISGYYGSGAVKEFTIAVSQ